MAKATLLIIEDNQEVRENLAEILELFDYEILTAENGLKGVHVARENLPDLILCDVMMPELDGYGVLNLLAEDERTDSIPFVFVTARTDKEDVRRGMNLGADDYITKPFFKDELLRVIETRLKKSRRNRPADDAPKTAFSDPATGLRRLEEAFAQADQQQRYDHGWEIVREDDYPRYVHRVISGHVHLCRIHEYGREYVIDERGPGEYFGLSAVLENAAFPYSAKVISEECSCELLPADELRQLVETNGAVAATLVHHLAGQVAERNERLVNQAYDSVRRRTALVLSDLHDKYPEETLHLSREELGQMVGTTKESVIRALSEFRKDGLLEVDGRRIKVLKPGVLRELLV